eukprot:gene9433-12712_t
MAFHINYIKIIASTPSLVNLLENIPSSIDKCYVDNPYAYITALRTDINNNGVLATRIFIETIDSGCFTSLGWILACQVNNCMSCAKKLSWKHHCRACGDVICTQCCSHELVVKEQEDLGELKVCNRCYEEQTLGYIVLNPTYTSSSNENFHNSENYNVTTNSTTPSSKNDNNYAMILKLLDALTRKTEELIRPTGIPDLSHLNTVKRNSVTMISLQRESLIARGYSSKTIIIDEVKQKFLINENNNEQEFQMYNGKNNLDFNKSLTVSHSSGSTESTSTDSLISLDDTLSESLVEQGGSFVITIPMALDKCYNIGSDFNCKSNSDDNHNHYSQKSFLDRIISSSLETLHTQYNRIAPKTNDNQNNTATCKISSKCQEGDLDSNIKFSYDKMFHMGRNGLQQIEGLLHI